MNTLLVPDPQPELPPQKRRYPIFAFVGIALGLFLAFFRAWVWSYGFVSAEVLGYAVGSAVVPALIAYLIAGRKSVRNFNRFALCFCGFSILFFLVSSKPPVSWNQHIGNLAKEAAGTKPVDDGGPQNMDELIRGAMRDALEIRKSFEQETARFTPELGHLYSIESFSHKDAMTRSLEAVRGVVAADQQYSQQIEDLPKRIEMRVQNSSLSDSDKRGFMEGIQKSYGSLKVLAVRRQAMEVEKQWSDATVGLYDFSLSNSGRITVDHGRLVVNNEKIRTEFNQRLKQSQTLRDNLLALNAELETAQNDALKQLGVTPKDIGLPEGNQTQK